MYLLNKDIAQLRWLCGLNTTDLAATLPNLSSLMQHLVAPTSRYKIIFRLINFPTIFLFIYFPIQHSDEGKMKRSESREQGFTPRSHSIASASHYLLKSAKWQPHRVSRSLAGSQMSLVDPSMASTVSLDHLTDSPQAGGYFRQPPPSQQHLWNSHSTSALSLDLAVDRLDFSPLSPLFAAVGSNHHGSAPDLRSPESTVPSSSISQSPRPSTFILLSIQKWDGNLNDTFFFYFRFLKDQIDSIEATKTEQNVSDHLNSGSPPAKELAESPPTLVPDALDLDDGMDSVSARTEALAISSTFKLRGRGRTTSGSSQNTYWDYFFTDHVVSHASHSHSSQKLWPLIFLFSLSFFLLFSLIVCSKFMYGAITILPPNKSKESKAFASCSFQCSYYNSGSGMSVIWHETRVVACVMGFWPVEIPSPFCWDFIVLFAFWKLQKEKKKTFWDAQTCRA